MTASAACSGGAASRCCAARPVHLVHLAGAGRRRGERRRLRQAIIATGSSLNRLPAGIVQSVWSSADALKLPYVPESLLAVGGGYIRLEMGLVYQGPWARKVSVVGFFPRLLMGADFDLVDVMVGQVSERLEEIMVDSKVLSIVEVAGGGKDGGGYDVEIEHADEGAQALRAGAGGHRPAAEPDDIGLQNTRVKTDDKGFILTGPDCRTDEPNIFAIGDVATAPCWPLPGQPRGQGGGRGHRARHGGLRQPMPFPPWCSPTRRSPGPG
ncbi:MAG: NAD(P)/FAD-dependent oxidoreductase [bacterium]|nr:NAD(P)/FAD-dependent oxidoreductase [bacterium]